ncbi:hypothetical protein M0R45_008574 [Rubus argutus]|uniref:Uncharacterized protein n=1 Tax=Rubus argutus TaxID=59490 RepID=A0AAW1Y5C6_RUBAR
MSPCSALPNLTLHHMCPAESITRFSILSSPASYPHHHSCVNPQSSSTHSSAAALSSNHRSTVAPLCPATPTSSTELHLILQSHQFHHQSHHREPRQSRVHHGSSSAPIHLQLINKQAAFTDHIALLYPSPPAPPSSHSSTSPIVAALLQSAHHLHRGSLPHLHHHHYATGSLPPELYFSLCDINSHFFYLLFL